jgi:hypothetical protein
MTSSFAHPSNLRVEDLGDKLCISVNLANANRVSPDTTKVSITAYYNDDCTVEQEFVSQVAIKDAVGPNGSTFVTFYKPKCRPANITLMVMESLVDGSEIELGQATVHAICYPDAPALSIISSGVSKLDEREPHKVKTSGVKLRVNLSKDGGFAFKSVHFFVNKKDNSRSPIMKLAPILLSDDDVAAGFADVVLPDVVTIADKMISINASVDNVAGLESNVSSVSVLVSNSIRPAHVEMVSAQSCQHSAVPVSVKVAVKNGAYVSVLARRADDDDCWSTTNVLNVPVVEQDDAGSLCATVTGLGETGDELLPFVTYHFAAVQHGSVKCASDDVCTLTKLMPDQSKLSNAVSAVPFADFRFSSQISLSAAGALSLDNAGVLHVAPGLAVSNMKSGEDFCSVWKFKQNGAVMDSAHSYDHVIPAFSLAAFEYTDSLELCADFYKLLPSEVDERVHSDAAVLDMEARPGKCLHVSGATLAFRPPPSSKAIPVPHALKLEFYNKALFVHHEDPVELMKEQQLAIKSIEYQVSTDAEFGEDSLQFLSGDKKTSVVVAAAADGESGIAEKSKHLLLYSGDGHVKSLAGEDSYYVRARYVVAFLNNIVLQSEWNEPAHSGLVNKSIKVTSITLKQTPPRDFNSLTTSFLSLIVEASVDVGHQMVQDVSVFVLIKHGANSHKAELLYDAASNVWRSAVLSPTPKVDYSAQPVHVCAVGPLNMDVKTL